MNQNEQEKEIFDFLLGYWTREGGRVLVEKITSKAPNIHPVKTIQVHGFRLFCLFSIPLPYIFIVSKELLSTDFVFRIAHKINKYFKPKYATIQSVHVCLLTLYLYFPFFFSPTRRFLSYNDRR